MRKFHPLRCLLILGIFGFFGISYLVGWLANQSSNQYIRFTLFTSEFWNNFSGGLMLVVMFCVCVGILTVLGVAIYWLFDWIFPKERTYH